MMILFLMVGCSTNVRISRPLESFTLVGQIDTANPVNKAIFSVRSNTVFALSKDWQQIHFFRDFKRVNSIGGMGLERSNFQRLSDIAVDSEGSLWALDTIPRKIRRFSSDGMWAGEIEIKGSAQPELLAVAADQTLFVYDALQGELICYSPLDGAELYRFGKFQLYRISNISVSRNYVVAYSAADRTSHIYSILGQYLGSQPAQVAFDEFDNKIVLDRGVLSSGESLHHLGNLVNPVLSISTNALCIASGNRIFQLRPVYEGRR